MAEVMKHVGKVGEKPCVVLYREVPGEAENALIVKTETLPDSQHDALMNVIGSAEAQESNDIADVLDRRQFADGQNMLQALHFDRRIEKVSVDLVTLTPTPSNSVSLAEVNPLPAERQMIILCDLQTVLSISSKISCSLYG